jgi:uncharacterized protein YbjQ (UPF0145 family)
VSPSLSKIDYSKYSNASLREVSAGIDRKSYPENYEAYQAEIQTRVARGAFIPHSMTTTAFTLHGYDMHREHGVVRGILVRSRSIIGSIGAGLQTLFGGNITLYSDLCEQTRRQAFDQMIEHAENLGANAVIGVRYDATEIMQGVTEVLAYGTAVSVLPHSK